MANGRRAGNDRVARPGVDREVRWAQNAAGFVAGGFQAQSGAVH
jgi:hypothetical protein